MIVTAREHPQPSRLAASRPNAQTKRHADRARARQPSRRHRQLASASGIRFADAGPSMTARRWKLPGPGIGASRESRRACDRSDSSCRVTAKVSGCRPACAKVIKPMCVERKLRPVRRHVTFAGVRRDNRRTTYAS
jgi:hypothetical protein